jgi:hypothetical protein
MMRLDMMTAAAACFVLHGLIGSVDGAYYHLKKYKLHTHEESFVEHQLHTMRAVFLSLIAFLLFALNSGGWLLWLAIVVLVADMVVLTWDVLLERASRVNLGGLSSKEYLVHVHATILHAASFSLVLASKPAAAWALSSPPLLPGTFHWMVWVSGASIGVIAAVSAIQHFWYWNPKYRRAS